jgi:tight adherence protein B
MFEITSDNLQLAIFLLIGVAVFLAAEAIYLGVSSRASYLRKINKRLSILENSGDQLDALVELRRARSLTSEGNFKLPLIWLNRLVLQSGITMGVGRFAMMFAGLAVVIAFAVYTFEGSALIAAAAGLASATFLPLAVLKFLRGRRWNAFEAQLPDAVDVMVRSLRAGHPLPVSISMVGRELPDPIGSEFGLTADELTYGLDLEAAMGNMASRVGQDDLALLIVAITIQARTGGNLGEILSNLSRILRTRFKMRRRVRSLSAEGRFSALALSILPFMVFGALTLFAPDFYGGIWEEPVVTQVLSSAFAFMMVGNFIMYRMIQFRM